MTVNPKARIKICGLTGADTAYRSVKLGADYIGLVFHTRSKRFVTVDEAREIADAVKAAGATPVAVFVEQDVEAMADICRAVGICTVQLHGDRARQQHTLLPSSMTKIYAINVGDDGIVSESDCNLIAQLDDQRDFLLFDGKVGGSGQRFNLNLLPALFQQYRCFIAGGLDADNVASVIATSQPYAVDVSSGVEGVNQQKCLTKVDAFIKQVKHEVFEV